MEQVWRKSKPICPVCGVLVEEHSEQLAFEHEEIIHARLQEAQHSVLLLQDIRTALSGQVIIQRRKVLANGKSRT